jgi:hypothetical protein
MAKQIEQITDTELLEIWSLIGGTPHDYQPGMQVLKEGLITGDFKRLKIDYYSLAAMVDCLRAKGYEAGLPGHRSMRQMQLLVIVSDGEEEISFEPISFQHLQGWATGTALRFISESNSQYYSIEILQGGARVVFIELTSAVSMERFMKLATELYNADQGAVNND